jgi:nickel-dependent lactate racemase
VTGRRGPPHRRGGPRRLFPVTEMRVAVDYGRSRAEYEVAEEALVPCRPCLPPPALPDPAAAVRDALEHPFHFPPLRRALTPDDHIAVVVDERLPQVAALIAPLVEHLLSAGIDPAAVTLLCPPTGGGQPWLEELPEHLQEVRLEVHDPKARRQLAYVTTMRGGRDLLLNRTAVDADQVVVLCGRRFDAALGQGGGEGALFPALSDAATRSEASAGFSLEDPGGHTWAMSRQASEAAWLLGAPFYVQVIEGAGDAVAHVVAGADDSLPEGQRLHNACWRRPVPRAADTVIAALGGDPSRHDFADLADAVACASRVLKPNGRIVVLSEASPGGASAALLREAGEPAAALAEVRRRKDYELRPAWQWATVAQQAQIYLLSGLPDEAVEELSATPLEGAAQVQRLVDAGRSCLFLPDAHKTLALVEP